MEFFLLAMPVMGLIFLAIMLNTLGSFLSKRMKKEVTSAHGSLTTQFFYSRKDNIMTDAEAQFFNRLQRISLDKYYVFPQIHLSAMLKNETKGKYWKAAYQRINRTSVDYVLVRKDNLQIRYAVELDDWSHDDPKRQSRDKGVEEMLASVGIPLVRFRNVARISDEEIIAAFKNNNKISQ